MDQNNSQAEWARILQRVDKSDPAGCWLYVGQLDRSGYGKHETLDHKWRGPHRISYAALVGPIPTGLVIDHLCRVRNCVNPNHLEPVTNRENLMRGETIAARRSAQTHCVNGHEFTPENTRKVRGGKHRQCIECARAAARRYKAKKRAAAA